MRSNRFVPSTQVCSQKANGLSGSPDHKTRSASFPCSMLPVRSPMPSCFAGLIVTNSSAFVGGRFPYFTAFAASVLRCRASSFESELKDINTPWPRIIAPSHGIASITSILYAHQSLKHDPPAPCRAIASATLYPSKMC